MPPNCYYPISQLEAQTNEKLAQVYQQLLQAGADKHESEREVRLKETIANLQRIFPGTLYIAFPAFC